MKVYVTVLGNTASHMYFSTEYKVFFLLKVMKIGNYNNIGQDNSTEKTETIISPRKYRKKVPPPPPYIYIFILKKSS
jgi:hypothetical protein